MHQVLSMMSVISTYSIASDIFFVRRCEGTTEIKFWCLKDEAHSTILVSYLQDSNAAAHSVDSDNYILRNHSSACALSRITLIFVS